MVDETVTEDRVPTRVADDLVQLDAVFDITQDKRKNIIDKLESVITNMDIKFEEPRMVEVQMQAVNTLRSLLNDQDAQITRRVGVKLKKEEASTASKHSADVVDLLSRIGLGHVTLPGQTASFNAEQAAERIESAFVAAALAPVLSGELKTDPTDLIT